MSEKKAQATQKKISPLTLYAELKQDEISQKTAEALCQEFSPGRLLPPDWTLHFLRIALIPNSDNKKHKGILVATIFDGPMNAYLDFFYKREELQRIYHVLCNIVSTPPKDPNTFTGFQTWVNNNNRNTQAQLAYAYTASAARIVQAFPPALPLKIHALTLYVPLLQTLRAQKIAEGVAGVLSGGTINPENLLHFVNATLIPNSTDGGSGMKHAGLLVLTRFDGSMNAYLNHFWNIQAIRGLWQSVPSFVDYDFKGKDLKKSFTFFEFFLNHHNLNKIDDLSSSYVAPANRIVQKFPLTQAES